MSGSSSSAGPSRLQWTLGRIRQHLVWARTQGVGRLVEEDQLNPVDRVRTAVRKARWRRRSGGAPGSAVPVWVVGLQRSGTNMLVRGLEQAPEVEVHNENDQAVFRRFRLREDAVVVDVLARSRHAFVLLKPLAESHRVPGLLGLGPVPGRAVWMYRDVDGRTRSALAKFGPSNLETFRALVDGSAGDAWQVQGLTPADVELVRSFDPATMTPETACSLFWYLRNELFFRQGLHRRDDVVAVSYERLVADPEGVLRGLCEFLGFPYRTDLASHVERRPPAMRAPLDVDPGVRALCDEMAARLDAVALLGRPA